MRLWRSCYTTRHHLILCTAFHLVNVCKIKWKTSISLSDVSTVKGWMVSSSDSGFSPAPHHPSPTGTLLTGFLLSSKYASMPPTARAEPTKSCRWTGSKPKKWSLSGMERSKKETVMVTFTDRDFRRVVDNRESSHRFVQLNVVPLWGPTLRG